MKVLRGWLILLLLLGGAYAAGYYYWTRPKPVDIRIARLARGRVEETVTSTKAGAVRARRVANLSVDMAGTISVLAVREGAVVRKGDLLLSIDRREAVAALASAQKELVVLQALVTDARARQLDAARERTRLEGLRRTGAITQAQLDQAATAVELAAAAIAAAEARVEAQQSALARAQIPVDKCDLRAPFDGVVTARYVEVGEWATPGKLVLQLLDPADLYIRAEIDEVDIGDLATGLRVRVTLDPYKDRHLEGSITRIAPTVSELQEQNRTVEVEAQLDGDLSGVVLRHGLSADLEVILRVKEGVLRVPSSALLEGNHVFRFDPDGIVRRVRLTIGYRNWEFAEVTGGAQEGDAIVTSLESEKVKEGVLGKVTEEQGK